MLQFKNVSKTYNGNVEALKDITFNVAEGDLVVLLGPSGCGKTTLLRMVNQLEDITSGRILVNGQQVQSMDKIKMRRDIGYAIQSTGLFPNMTIEKNAMIVPDLLGWDRKKKRERFNYLMDLVGLNPDEYRNRYPHELSGGQQQRIGVARALAADPPVMLMDEPFGALDPIIRSRLQEEFLTIQKEIEKTILFVSHDIDEAIKMGDKIALLHEGEIMQYAQPAELLNNPKNEFVSEFVGKDRILKSMSLYSISHLMDIVSLNDIKQMKQSVFMKKDTSLRIVISTLLNQEADQLIVIDENDNEIGSITLNLIELFLEREIKGKGVE